MSAPTTGRGGKSRIVIDVDKFQQKRPSARRAGRGMRIFKIVALAIAGALLVAAVGGYIWWRSFRESPEYSLALLVDAAQQNDLPEVERIIDSDRVTEGLVPLVIEKLTGNASMGAAAASVAPQIGAAAPQLHARVREVVREEVAREVKAFSEKTGDQRVPFVLLALGLKQMAEVKEEGDAANISLSAEGHAMELGMARNGDRWKVVSIKNDALTSAITARITPNVPAIIAQPTPTPPARRRGGR
jgi:hypothetical protein